MQPTEPQRRPEGSFRQRGYRMLLSIVVPSYNDGAYLARCLRSLLDQDLDPSDYEVIVINDGSEDDSPEIASSFALDNPNVVVHSQENQGHSVARNAGIRLAAGKYIWFVDPDDYINSNVLAGLVTLMDRQQLQILAFDYAQLGPDDDFRTTRVHFPLSGDVRVIPGMEYMSRQYPPDAVWGYLLNRKFLLDSGIRFEPGKVVEDTVFTANVMSAANRMAHVPVDVYRYVYRPGSQMNLSGTAHTVRLAAGYEGVVFGLEELRQRMLMNGTATTAFVNRLVMKQETYVFFMIVRLLRSQVPMRPILPEALERFRAINMYPLTRFPGRDYKGVKYRLLTLIFNREYLLYPFGRIVGLFYVLRRLGARRSRP